MHIAFNGWFWDKPNTGSGQYLRRLLQYLRRSAPELQLTLILPPHNKAPDELPENVSFITTSGPGGKIGKVWFEQRTFPKMAERCQADIAHVPYWGPPLSSPVKLVTTVLDVVPLAIPDYSQGLSNRLYVSLVKAAATGSSHTITISDAAKTDIVEYLKLPPESITTTYLGVDERFHPQKGMEKDEDVRQKYNLPDQFVLYIGGFDLRKQLNQLIYAYTYVMQSEGEYVPLVLAGKEPQWGTSVFPDIRKYAEELGITDVTCWPGYIDEEDIPSLYRLADVFVYPSMYEGFGLPVIEAMACGTPVVANAIDIFTEIAGDSAFLVGNAREMGGAIISLVNEKDLSDSFINQGLAQATRYNWRKTAKETLAVYENIMLT
jgi:glycosyltransferase involved in cell wall biosynthesis